MTQPTCAGPPSTLNPGIRRAARPAPPTESTAVITLRPVEATDLDEFFSHQLDQSANHMAAFGAKNPADRGVFDHHWQDILNDRRITVRTILSDGEVVGSILAYHDGETPEIRYWIDRSRWGQGITTAVVGQDGGSRFPLAQFFRDVEAKRVALNVASFVAWLGAATSQTAYTASKGAVLAMTREIAVRYREDERFRQQATRYIQQFESLLNQAAECDPENVLSATFLTADVGKLYLLLARAVGRQQ